MKKQIESQSEFFNPRAAFAVLLCGAACSVVTGTLLAFLPPEAPTKVSQRTLTFEERVAYQRAIEDVYWRHRIWPNERPDPKPSLDALVSQAQLERKVAVYLRNSQALEDHWQRPITPEQLQAELNRMAQHTKQPEVLRELFEALGNDPFVIAECLARPALAERFVTSFYAYDQSIHGELRQRAEAELQVFSAVEQMKKLSGSYREIEVVKSGNAGEEDSRGRKHSVKLSSAEWDQTVQTLAITFAARRANVTGMFEIQGSVVRQSSESIGGDDGTSVLRKNVTGEDYNAIPTGKLSALQEDETCYYATAVIDKTERRLRLATVSWPKESVESWASRTANGGPTTTATPYTEYTLPAISDAGCIDDTWAASSINSPIGRWHHTAVWTGSEMIVWGGENDTAVFSTGGRYDPSTDTWTATGLSNVPFPRTSHTAVWTGSEMIVWGGFDGSNDVNTGGRYNPSSNSWAALSTVNSPTGRQFHTAVWTGNEMIVWGGYSLSNEGEFNTGGRYNPDTNTWTATSTTNAPAARHFHTAVWTGTEMIIWGGFDFLDFTDFDTGGRYNPNTNSWTATSTTSAPSSRRNHTAIWTGSEMIVWGGSTDADGGAYFNTGARYNPNTNSWTATNTTGPPDARAFQTAVWNGSEMIIWGGENNAVGYMNTGGRYNPGMDTWAPTGIINAPSSRWRHTAIWTGTEMIVWGGEGDNGWSGAVGTGGRYDPATNTWTTTNGNAPTGRRFHTAVWTGSEMIVWGGEDDNHSDLAGDTNTGGRYDPSTDNWTSTSMLNAPSPRQGHTAIWTGDKMIVWGGDDYFGTLNTGGRYNPVTNGWQNTMVVNALAGRTDHTAVWSGTQMIVWGGEDVSGPLSSGVTYNADMDTWAAISNVNAPTARWRHTAVWTGSEMIIWGGTNANQSQYFTTGGRYNPGTNSWIATNTSNAPEGRALHTVVWTGNEMIIWGGYFTDSVEHDLNTGGRYDPSANSWTATSTLNAPSGRASHIAVWTSREMIAWGGDAFAFYGTGGRYNPDTNSWTATTTSNAPTGRWGPTAVWTGSEMIAWGGFESFFGPTDTGGRYCAETGPTPTPTPTPTPCTGRCGPTPRPHPAPHNRPTPPIPYPNDQ